MRKGVIAVVVGMGMLFAHAVNAGEMVRYEHGLYVADASVKDKKADKKMHHDENKVNKHHHKHGHKHHKHHHHHHHQHYGHHHHRYHRDSDEGIRTQSSRERDEMYGTHNASRATSMREQNMQEYINDTAPDHR